MIKEDPSHLDRAVVLSILSYVNGNIEVKSKNSYPIFGFTKYLPSHMTYKPPRLPARAMADYWGKINFL